MLSKYIIMFSLFFFFSCTASPRFSSSNKTYSKYKYSKSKIKKSTQKSYLNELNGFSSWYGPNFHGKLTANGEVFDQYAFSAAHRTLPLNSVVKVTNLDNGKVITVRINDRGPFIDEHKRILDCSYGAAKKLEFIEKGTAKIKIEIVELGDNKYIKRK